MALPDSIDNGAPKFSHFFFMSSIESLHSSGHFCSGLPGRKTQSAMKESKPHTAPPKQIAVHPPVAPRKTGRQYRCRGDRGCFLVERRYFFVSDCLCV